MENKIYEPADGVELEFNIDFARLLKLQNEDEDLFRKVNKVLHLSDKDDMDLFIIADFLWGCYLMATPKDDRLEHMEFLEQLGFNLDELTELMAFLLQRAVPASSRIHSSGARAKRRK